jgi:flagellar basal body-associated protein FliL
MEVENQESQGPVWAVVPLIIIIIIIIIMVVVVVVAAMARYIVD